MRYIEDIRKAEQRDRDTRVARQVKKALEDLVEATDYIFGEIQDYSVSGEVRAKNLITALEVARNLVGTKSKPDLWPGDEGFVEPHDDEGFTQARNEAMKEFRKVFPKALPPEDGPVVDPGFNGIGHHH